VQGNGGSCVLDRSITCTASGWGQARVAIALSGVPGSAWAGSGVLGPQPITVQINVVSHRCSTVAATQSDDSHHAVHMLCHDPTRLELLTPHAASPCKLDAAIWHSTMQLPCMPILCNSAHRSCVPSLAYHACADRRRPSPLLLLPVPGLRCSVPS
jgi:hypothetical protein